MRLKIHIYMHEDDAAGTLVRSSSCFSLSITEDER